MLVYIRYRYIVLAFLNLLGVNPVLPELVRQNIPSIFQQVRVYTYIVYSSIYDLCVFNIIFTVYTNMLPLTWHIHMIYKH